MLRTFLCAAIFFISTVCSFGQLREPLPVSPLAHTNGIVELGWYLSSDVYKYLADVNLEFDIGSFKGATINFTGGILTLVKSTDEKSFQPDRYRGTLQLGIYWTQGLDTYQVSLRHQSFHSIDRVSDLSESYELLNFTYQRQEQPNYTFAIGKYIRTEDVDYDWDFFAQYDTGCLGACLHKAPYITITGHYVTETDKLSNRNSFFDFELETGIQTSVGVRYFTAYRRLHDIDRFNGTTDNQVVIGIKYIW